MPLFDFSGDINQLQQVLLGALDRLKEIVEELRDQSEVEIKISFKKRKP